MGRGNGHVITRRIDVSRSGSPMVLTFGSFATKKLPTVTGTNGQKEDAASQAPFKFVRAVLFELFAESPLGRRWHSWNLKLMLSLRGMI